MNKEPLQKALDAFESIFASTTPYTVDGACVLSDGSVRLMNEAVASIKLALAQPADHFAGAGKAMDEAVKTSQLLGLEGFFADLVASNILLMRDNHYMQDEAIDRLKWLRSYTAKRT